MQKEQYEAPEIRISDSGAIIYGTPWDGKHHLSNNIAVSLKAICILERAKKTLFFLSHGKKLCRC